MKIGVCITLSEDDLALREKLVTGPQMVERLGFDGLWFFDTIGRARALPVQARQGGGGGGAVHGGRHAGPRTQADQLVRGLVRA